MNLYAWYEFDKDSELLEINPECEVISEMFKDKCKTAEKISNGFPTKKYDYIILTGVLCKLQGTSCATYLSELKNYLNPNGKILIAENNRLGLKYFCGEKEEISDKVYEGIRNYPDGTVKGRAFSKKELSDTIELSGLKYKFYYPLSDYKFTQAIYTDAYLPQKNIVERLMNYYQDKSTLIADERTLYNDIIDNNVFPFFSNSFLVECSLNDDFCNVIYASISADRRLEDACITIICDDDTAKKMPFYHEGIPNIHKQYDNLLRLNKYGIKTVNHTLCDNKLVMPYIKSPKLSDYLRDLVKINIDEFINIFDRLNELILNSSDYTSENALINDENADLEFGPILKHTSIELIPLNCFYIDNDFYFFDQEFVFDNYPAKFVLYRAVKYVYMHAPETEKFISQKVLKKRYGLTALWKTFENAEKDFQKNLRLHDKFHEFRKHIRADKTKIENNISKLMAESSSVYSPDEKMLAVRQVELDLLRKLDKICEENDLKYYLLCGTLLGAVRHKGFIPWDDDIDVAMFRSDFEKLKEICANLDEPYFLQTAENDKDCFNNGIMKLRNSNTTGVPQKDIGHDCNSGIWIDILALDSCVRDPEMLKLKRRAVKKAMRMLYAKVYGDETADYRGMDEEIWEMYCDEAKKVPHDELCENLYKACTMYNDENSEYVATFSHNNYQPYCREDFKSIIKLNFENYEFNAPVGYKRVLQMSKGKDYMTLPPFYMQTPHHDGIFLTDVPYKRYLGMFNNILSDAEGKTIVIFGAGIMVEDYLTKYGNKYKPEFLVDNDKTKWGKEKFGISIENPEFLKGIPNLHLIICSVYYREIEKQLNEMGITEFKVYAKEKKLIAGEERDRER